jgi:hypothetical protein
MGNAGVATNQKAGSSNLSGRAISHKFNNLYSSAALAKEHSCVVRPVFIRNRAHRVFGRDHRQGDLLGDSRTAPVGITLLHFHDRTDEFCARSFRAGLPMPIRGE